MDFFADMTNWGLRLALLGAVCGLVVGATSTGGGALLTPGLIVLGIPAPTAIGSDLLIASVMKLFGGGMYALRGQVHWPTVRWLACGSVPGALVGVQVMNLLPAHWMAPLLRQSVGAAVLLAGVATLVRVLWQHSRDTQNMPRPWVTVLLGVLIGGMVATTSIGSGSLLMCALVLLFPLSSSTLVGTDLAHALMLSAAATVAHVVSSRVDFVLAGWVLLGGVPGVMCGARLSGALPERPLRGALACILILTGGYLGLPHTQHTTLPAQVVSNGE